MLNPDIANVNIFLLINDKQLPIYVFIGLGQHEHDRGKLPWHHSQAWDTDCFLPKIWSKSVETNFGTGG
jgi:hypothetical protein